MAKSRKTSRAEQRKIREKEAPSVPTQDHPMPEKESKWQAFLNRHHVVKPKSENP